MTRFSSLLVAAIALAPLPLSASDAPARVNIAMANFRFTPAAIHLAAGKPVTLHFTSSGSHDFSAPQFFRAASMDAANRAKVAGGKVEMEGDDTVDVTLTPKAGSYEARCTHFLHSSFGMTGTITVS